MFRRNLFITVCLGCLFMPIQVVQAQGSLFERLEIGASVNYSTLHYEEDGDFLNNVISYDVGFQIHTLINHSLSEKFNLQSGFEYFFYTYGFEDQTTPQIGQDGEATGNYLRLSMTEDFNTSYLTLPLRVQYQPFSKHQIYFTAGPDFSYKIGYSNGMLESALYSENDELLQVSLSDENEGPELANDFLVSGVAGIGYDLNHKLPIAIELRAKHSITPYLSGENYINSWIRSLSLSVSYNL